MTDFQSGLWVSLIGLTITFVALGVFIGVIVLLKNFFPYKAEEVEEAEETMAIAEADDDDNAAVAAAIAAITYLRSQKKGQLGA
jgi:Na+-transporting methylmalonyl-CoA/oxaloacetate decarboxylase gamma subunit